MPSTGTDGIPFLAGRAGDGGGRTGGLRSVFPNRVPRRVIEVAVAAGSLAAVLVVVALVLSSGGDDGGGGDIASGGVDSTALAGPDRSPDGGDSGGQGPTEFTSDIDLDDGEGDGDGTDDPSPTTTTTDRGTSSTTGSTTTSTTLDTSTSTTGSTTSTTKPTTTSLPTTTTTVTTTTSTTTPTVVPIRIVSGPSINVINQRSFQFNYSTNDVCGTGSFRVTKVSSGAVVGTFAGADVCFGPQHGGYPGLQGSAEFQHIILEPGTTYRVNVTVRGTASDGIRTAGSGSDSTSFQVTTAAS